MMSLMYKVILILFQIVGILVCGESVGTTQELPGYAMARCDWPDIPLSALQDATPNYNSQQEKDILYYNSRPDRIKPESEIHDERMYIRLARGSPALAYQFPFASSIEINGIHSCGGILIQPRTVLTAGHCVIQFDDNNFFDPRSISVFVGSTVRGEGQQYLVDQIIVPSIFDPRNGFFGDIALLELSDASNQTTAFLEGSPANESLVTAIGWGYTSPTSVLSPTLQHTILSILDHESCRKFHWQKGMGEHAPADHFCAGDMTTGADTCRGDSGGPLLEGDFLVVGITSYGAYGSKCGDVNSTGVYTNVSFWYPWIIDSMSLFNLEGESIPDRLNAPLFDTCWQNSGASYKSSTTETVGRCVEMCRKESTCKNWQWMKQSQVCSLAAEDMIDVEESSFCHTGTMT